LICGQEILADGQNIMRRISMAFGFSLVVFAGLVAWLTLGSRAPNTSAKVPHE